jgi:hypothetical protein
VVLRRQVRRSVYVTRGPRLRPCRLLNSTRAIHCGSAGDLAVLRTCRFTDQIIWTAKYAGFHVFHVAVLLPTRYRGEPIIRI